MDDRNRQQKILEGKIEIARLWLLKNHPFYGLMTMEVEDVISASCPTACTNGKRITWGLDYCSKLTTEELRYLLFHEILHVCLLHMWRLPCNEKGNIAADYHIEKILRNVKGISMPKGGLICPQDFFDKDVSEEEIFLAMEKEKNNLQNPPKSSKSSPSVSVVVEDSPSSPEKFDVCGSFEAPPEEDDDEEGISKESTKDRIIQKMVSAQMVSNLSIGSSPGEIFRTIEKELSSRIDWKEQTLNFLRAAILSKNDWARNSRRNWSYRPILPRRKKEDDPTFIAVRDVSGSVSPSDLNEFTSVIQSFLDENRGRCIVIDTDTDVRQEIYLEKGEQCPLETVGGGGTHFEKVMKRVEELVMSDASICGMIFITDMMTSSFGEDPGIPVLWIASEKTRRFPSFGKVVEIERSLVK